MFTAKQYLIAVLALIFFFPVDSMSQANWRPLFNGENLDGWVKKNGTAEYHVEGNTIVGVAELNTPNTFLTTEETFGDFILEFEVKVDPRLNSGVQIRSLSRDNYRNGRVHGYQVEIDPSERKWSGGIYDEARRGWLYPLSRNDVAQGAFRNGVWNHFRVEAVGNEIRTWINGIQCANLYDSMTPEGFIGLQVHSISDPEAEGARVEWRNIRILTDDPERHQMKRDPEADVINWIPNTLTRIEKDQGWRLLFDGESTDGWRGANSDTFPEKGWIVEGNALTVLESGGDESRFAGDIVTMDEFSNFEFELEFKITEGANSGIKYFVIEGLNPGSGSEIGPEFQILDDVKHPDAKQGMMGNRTVGSLYDLITAENLSEPNRTSKRFKGVGAWNKARIIARDGKVEHWLNNVKVVEYDRKSQIFRNLIEKSKYNVYENFGQADWGHILLQDHGNRVSFRSIKVREL